MISSPCHLFFFLGNRSQQIRFELKSPLKVSTLMASTVELRVKDSHHTVLVLIVFFAFLCYSFHILLFYSHKPLEINVVQLYSFWETENDVQNCWLVLVFMIMLLSKEEMQLSNFKFYDIIAVWPFDMCTDLEFDLPSSRRSVILQSELRIF